jgi:mono/diheme cytochrome c family protein
MSKRVISGFISILLLGLLLVACGGRDDSAASAGDAGRGQALYEQTILGPNAAPGCVTCHSREAGKTLVGPSHAGLATIAESAVPGKTAEEFLKESISDPNAHVTEGFAPGVMYQNYGKDLSEQEINDIVAYLLTLK